MSQLRVGLCDGVHAVLWCTPLQSGTTEELCLRQFEGTLSACTLQAIHPTACPVQKLPAWVLQLPCLQELRLEGCEAPWQQSNGAAALQHCAALFATSAPCTRRALLHASNQLPLILPAVGPLTHCWAWAWAGVSVGVQPNDTDRSDPAVLQLVRNRPSSKQSCEPSELGHQP